MAKIGDYKIENFYQGGYSTFDSSKGIGSIGDLGMATDPRVANIVKDASHKLSAGAKTIEISQVSPEVFDSVPNEQLKETKRMANLLGVDVTFHAPVVEPAGMTQQGFSESNRIAVENQMKQAVERAATLKPHGNIPVTFHSSAGVPSFMPAKGEKQEQTYVIDVKTGSPHPLPLETRKFPGEEGEIKGKIDADAIKKQIDAEIRRFNEDQWSNQKTSLSYAARMANMQIKEGKSERIAKGKGQGEAIGNNYLEDAYRQLKRLYDVAYSSAEKNKNISDKNILDDFYKRAEKRAIALKTNPNNPQKVEIINDLIEDGLSAFNSLSTPPQVVQDINDFAKDKTTETFANVALNTYEKFVKKGKKAPIICIENPPAGTTAFNTGEDLKMIIDRSREKFVEKLRKKGISKSEAKKQAEQLIGATWDVGHINMMRKYGYSEKDVIKQSEKIAPVVKHVHLSDNFGMEHTELPMGMGNVPMKEIMEKLGEKGYDAKKIIEAGNWWQHFSEQGKVSPFQPTIESFGSPIYSEGVGPYWNQVIGLQQGYFGGYGNMLPQGNYNMFGSGFSMASLPVELGGQMPGGQGQGFSGRGME